MSDRDADGTLQIGHGVKSPGRPKGVSSSELVRALLDPNRDEVFESVATLAKQGEPNAQRIFMSYYPAPRPESEKVVIPGLAAAPELRGKADAVIAAVANGIISFEAGERALRMIGTYLHAITASDHEERLRALEDGKAKLKALDSVVEDRAVTDEPLEDLI